MCMGMGRARRDVMRLDFVEERVEMGRGGSRKRGGGGGEGLGWGM